MNQFETYAFSDLKAEKLTSATAVDNQPSCNLLSRLGLKQIREEIASFQTENPLNSLVLLLL
jgi:RimJ/RimL family protein N-acetyltransferase